MPPRDINSAIIMNIGRTRLSAFSTLAIIVLPKLPIREGFRKKTKAKMPVKPMVVDTGPPIKIEIISMTRIQSNASHININTYLSVFCGQPINSSSFDVVSTIFMKIRTIIERMSPTSAITKSHPLGIVKTPQVSMSSLKHCAVVMMQA